MHDPYSVAFDIKNPFVRKRSGFRPNLITIWHVDPNIKGDDDSCGFCIRERHIDKMLLDKIRSHIRLDYQYIFDEFGFPKYSTQAIVLQLYRQAAWTIFSQNDKKFNRFWRRHLHEILFFAENHIDSLHSSITNQCLPKNSESRINHLSAVITGDILRKSRKWHQHPRWHIYHWEIQWNFIQDIKEYFKPKRKPSECKTGKFE